MSMETGYLSIAELQQGYAAGTLKPSAVTEALLDRIERLDPALDSFLLVTADKAKAAAAAADAEIAAGRYRGGLHGVPYSLKDIYCTAGIRTTAHSKLLEHHVPDQDAFSVARIEEAGGVLLGKNATWEFAHGGPAFDLPWPPARNPWNRDHSPGGSSSGSAAALAAGLVPASLGSDTGGSIRGPAAACGVAGHKPTYGLVSRMGVLPNCFTHDHAGPLARTAQDCAIVLQAIAGHDPADPASADRPVPDFTSGIDAGIAGLKIGWCPAWLEDAKVGGEAAAAFEAALAVFNGLGAKVVEVAMPPIADYSHCKKIIAMAELFTIHAPDLRRRPEDFGSQLRYRIIAGGTIRAEDYINAQRWRQDLLTGSRAAWGDLDLFLLPTAAGGAGVLQQSPGSSLFTDVSLTTPFNVTGQPALAIPMGFTASGLPLSIQIAGRAFDDAGVLRAGHAYQQATDWHRLRPPLAT